MASIAETLAPETKKNNYSVSAKNSKNI